jgi:hypothetical protein
MLKELAAVSPEAGQQLKAGIPAPPRAEEVFSGMRFGVPDQEAGRKYLREMPVELTRWVNELQAAAAPAVISLSGSPAAIAAPAAVSAAPEPAAPPAAPPSAPVAPAAPPAPAQPAAEAPQPLRLEVVALGATRELDYGVVTEPEAPATPGSPPAPPRPARPRSAAFGFVEFDGPVDDTTVLVNGKPLSGQSSGKLQLPVGNYEIRMVRGGEIIDRQKVEVRPSSTTRIVVKR